MLHLGRIRVSDCSFQQPRRTDEAEDAERSPLPSTTTCSAHLDSSSKAQCSAGHEMADEPGALNWRLSAHPITLLCYLGFRIGMPILLPASDTTTTRSSLYSRMVPF